MTIIVLNCESTINKIMAKVMIITGSKVKYTVQVILHVRPTGLS